MARVLTIHGVAPNVDRRRFAFRNMADTGDMRRFLSSAPAFVPLADALAGRGTALTIDDATRSAADAAMLAREYGHAVSLFVNPGQVESGASHSFLILNALLDSLDGAPCAFERTTFPTSTMSERQALRLAIKERLRVITDEQSRLDLLAMLAAEWRTGPPEVPPHFRTLGKHDLVALRDAGVDVQNHGWSHTHHGSLSPEASAREIREGRAWLRRELDVDAPYFAAPFGDALPHPEVSGAYDIWFTVDEALPPGWYAPNVFNREELDPRAPANSTLRRGLRGLARHLLGLIRS